MLGPMLLLGLASGMHCAGMCGPISAGFTLVRPGNVWPCQLAFNAGRITSHAAAGTAAGALGSAAAYAASALPAQDLLYLAASAITLLAGLRGGACNRSPRAFYLRARFPSPMPRASPGAGCPAASCMPRLGAARCSSPPAPWASRMPRRALPFTAFEMDQTALFPRAYRGAMENIAAILAALALSALYIALLWLAGRGVDAVKNCASCSLRPVCETGSVVDCPNVRRLRQMQ